VCHHVHRGATRACALRRQPQQAAGLQSRHWRKANLQGRGGGALAQPPVLGANQAVTREPRRSAKMMWDRHTAAAGC